ncbi:lipid A deacylase LpxR family protein [Acidocella sp.]|uniref:lipid A deacylase LpxR family protein n=1 Tax=Acidocella sp. TaxID=50710 RepID=UPI00260727D2|nr:lipid A deacylase LpxR family protein [Acidocella sp.]
MKTNSYFCAALLAATAFIVPGAARAAPALWTLQDENASITATSPTDRYYVNGLHVGWTSATGDVPDVVSQLGTALFGDGTQRVSIGLTHQLYTPYDTTAINPPMADEPYAGYLAVNLALIQDSANARSVLGVSLGVIGAGAGGEIVQNGFHALIGQSGTHGWAYQLPTEPAVDFIASRVWRVPTGRLFGLETDALPQISGQAGLTADYVQPALGWRIGSGLDSDFGPPLLAPSPSGADAYTVVQPLAWYVFASAGAKLVAHDEVLQGADFQSSRGVPLTPVVGSFELGGAVIWHGLRFSYIQMFQTSRFHAERGNIHEFGSLAVSGSF